MASDLFILRFQIGDDAIFLVKLKGSNFQGIFTQILLKGLSPRPECFPSIRWFLYFYNYLGSSSSSSSSLAESTTNIGIDELKGLSQESSHLAGPHQKEGHPKDGIEHGDHPTPVGLWGYVAITWDKCKWKLLFNFLCCQPIRNGS